MARIHRVGLPETESEALAIRALAERLPDDYVVVHNFELATGRGLPYEFDIAVVTDFAVWHVEVKGYRGSIQGDERVWVLENGGTQPSPIPLANKKSRILAGRLRRHAPALDAVFVDTVILLTDDRVRVRLHDDQARRVIHLADAFDHLTNPANLAVTVDGSIGHLHPTICEALLGCKPRQAVKQIGLYDVLERINQTDTRTVFLAEHRYIRTRPKTILKVFHFDPYAKEAEKERQIRAIFHDQDALRLLGTHPNLVTTGDMFAWEDNKFVLPTEYIEGGATLRQVIDEAGDRDIPWSEKTRLIAGMARGLLHAHRNGVIHRDLRPLNVVIAPGGIAKLVNFDLALLRGSEPVLEPKGLVRRLDRRYAAPEVLADPGSATRRSDLYSLGLVFYELLTGQRAYEDPDAVRDETPLDVDLLRKELATPGSEDFMSAPEDAIDVIRRMCARDPADRQERLEEILEDLEILA